MKVLLCLLLFHMCLLPKMLCAHRNSDTTTNYWIRGAGGIINWNAGVDLSLNISKNNILYSLQGIYARHQPNPELGSIVQLSPMIGLIYDNDFFSASISSGISHISATNYKQVPTNSLVVIFPKYRANHTNNYYGVPLSGRFHFLVTTKVAFSFSAQHTFCKKDYNSFTFGIEFGYFGNRKAI